jgi:hypothetical protein
LRSLYAACLHAPEQYRPCNAPSNCLPQRAHVRSSFDVWAFPYCLRSLYALLSQEREQYRASKEPSNVLPQRAHVRAVTFTASARR